MVSRGVLKEGVGCRSNLLFILYYRLYRIEIVIQDIETGRFFSSWGPLFHHSKEESILHSPSWSVHPDCLDGDDREKDKDSDDKSQRGHHSLFFPPHRRVIHGYERESHTVDGHEVSYDWRSQRIDQWSHQVIHNLITRPMDSSLSCI